jgi:hypothetical protein
MGNQQSAPPQCAPGCSPTSPISQAISLTQTRNVSATPDPVSVCQANKIAASTLENQLNTANNAVDQCDPSVKLARTARELGRENAQFVNQYRTQQNTLNNELQDKFKMGNDLAEAVSLLKHYEAELKTELETSQKDAIKMEHDERKYRRDFLDNEPTNGVPWHVFGFQTSDDKVMLTFWIVALVSFSLLAHVALITLQPNSTFKFRAISGTTGVVLALVACYSLITYYG